MTLIQIYELIKSDKLRFITKEIRRLTAEGRHKEARRMKMQLPAFVVAALFPEERKTEQAGPYTGYVLVDVDGLFSRFLAYTIDKPVEWKNLTDEDDKQSTGEYYPKIGERILRAGLFLDQNATFVHYTKQQRDRMNARFRRLTEKAQLYGDNERQGIVNRLGHAHFRICMTLTALRKAEQQCTQENMLISDIDFNNAMEFILVFHEHILSLSTRLKKEGECPPATNPNIYEQIFNELPDEFRTADMTLRATSHGIAPRTSARRLKIWLDKELIFKLSAGKYIKKKQPEASNQ